MGSCRKPENILYSLTNSLMHQEAEETPTFVNSAVSIHCVARGLCRLGANFRYKCPHRAPRGGPLRQHSLPVNMSVASQ